MKIPQLNPTKVHYLNITRLLGGVENNCHGKSVGKYLAYTVVSVLLFVGGYYNVCPQGRVTTDFLEG
jgi:hypothetical protein